MSQPHDQQHKSLVCFEVTVKVRAGDGHLTESWDGVGEFHETPAGGLLIRDLDLFPKVMYARGEWSSITINSISAVDVTLDEDPEPGQHVWRPGAQVTPANVVSPAVS